MLEKYRELLTLLGAEEQLTSGKTPQQAIDILIYNFARTDLDQRNMIEKIREGKLDLREDPMVEGAANYGDERWKARIRVPGRECSKLYLLRTHHFWERL